MATSLEEQIADVMVSKFQTITVANSNEQTVVNVDRPSEPQTVGDYQASAALPSLLLRMVEKTVRWHLRGAEECVGIWDAMCMVAADATDERISDLIADVKKIIYANPRWHNGSTNLAQRSWVIEDAPHEIERSERVAVGHVRFAVLYRADRTNPFTVKAV